MNKNRRDQVQVLGLGEPDYPALLQEIKDPPKNLYYIGQKKLLSSRCAAVVGSRTTTAYGRNSARAAGRCLGDHGITVVSGLAAGIDACAHEGTLSCGGMTIAVLGCGPDICYPAANHQLMDRIAGSGLVLSEYPPGTPAAPYHFPRRNRIISGLSEILLVVQARVRSGALITAELAAEQGREVYAVPGNIDSQYHLGTNQLIRDGASVITTVEEILEPLGLAGGGREAAAESLSETEYSIYRMLRQQGEMTADEICVKISRQPSYVVPILSAMELKGFVCSGMGKFFLANP